MKVTATLVVRPLKWFVRLRFLLRTRTGGWADLVVVGKGGRPGTSMICGRRGRAHGVCLVPCAAVALEECCARPLVAWQGHSSQGGVGPSRGGWVCGVCHTALSRRRRRCPSVPAFRFTRRARARQRRWVWDVVCFYCTYLKKCLQYM